MPRRKEEKPFGIIYRATNTVNGKVYIGKTTQSLAGRKRGHKYASKEEGSDRYFNRAIRKHGWEFFEWDIIDEVWNENEEEAEKVLNQLEEDWITFYDSTTKENGYNLTLGGEGTKGYKMPEHFKEKLRARAFDREYVLNHSRQAGIKPYYIFNKEGELVGEYEVLKWGADEIGVYYQAFVNAYKGVTKYVGDYIIILKEEFSEEVLKERLSKAWVGFAGTNNPRATITEEEAEEIKLMINHGFTYKEVNETIPVSDRIFHHIKKGTAWKHVGEPITVEIQQPMSVEEVVSIKKELMKGKLSQFQIGEKFNVSQSCISQIYLEKNWSNLKVEGWDEWKAKQIPVTKKTEEEVIQIKKMLMANVSWEEIMNTFSIGQTTLFEISKNTRFSEIYVDGWNEYLENKYKTKHEKMEKAKQVKKLLLKGLKQKEIAEKLGITRDMVSSINQDESWTSIEVEGWAEYQAKRKAWNKKVNLTKEIVFKILELTDNGYSNRQIAEMLDYPFDTIKNFKSRRTKKYEPFIEEYFQNKSLSK